MKRLLLLLFLGFVMTSPVVHAQGPAEEPNTVVLNAIDGTSYRFTFDEREFNANFLDNLNFAEQELTVHYVSPQTELLTLSFTRAEVKDITFEYVTPSAIVQTKTEGQQKIDFRLTGNGVISVNGLTTGDQLQVVKADGRSVLNAKVKDDSGLATIDLSRQGHGLYIVTVNKRFTFKIMKP